MVTQAAPQAAATTHSAKSYPHSRHTLAGSLGAYMYRDEWAENDGKTVFPANATGLALFAEEQAKLKARTKKVPPPAHVVVLWQPG